MKEIVMLEQAPSNLKKVGSAPHHDLLIAKTDDILIVLPEQGFKDTQESSRITVAALQAYARELGRKCGLVIVANNLLAQEPESRRIYAENVIPELFFGIAMVAASPISRIIGSMAVRLGAVQVPICVVESIDAGIAWLETQRKQ
jgi:hypothetical protein